MKKHVFSALAMACASVVWAQTPGIVYPTLPTDAKSVTAPAVPPPIQASAPTAAPSTAPVYTAPVFKDPRRLDMPQEAPSYGRSVSFKDPRRLDLAALNDKQDSDKAKEPEPVKIVKKKADKRPTLLESDQIDTAAKSEQPSRTDTNTKIDQLSLDVPEPASAVSVTKGKDGSKIIKAEVPSSTAEAEALVAAQLSVPGYKPSQTSTQAALAPSAALNQQFAAAGVAQQNPPVTNTGLDAKPLPKWVTDSLDKNSGRNQILVMPGVTEIIRIGRNFPNRLVTPFESAEVITTDENLTHDGVGGAVIVATSSDKPIGIFLQDRMSDRAIPLMLIPEDIPQRDIRFTLDESWGVPTLRNNAEQNVSGSVPSAQSDYVEYVKLLMRSMAKGEVPDGHAMAPLQPELAPFCQSPGLLMRLGQMLEGSKTRIAVYTASNQTKNAVPFQEAGCYRAGVLAVSAFPRPVMEPGQDTEVFVILRKDVTNERASAKRRPTLVSQQ